MFSQTLYNFLTAPKKRKNPNVHQLLNEYTDCGISCNGILLSHTKEWSTNTCYNKDKPRKHYTKWKKLVTRGHTYCTIPSIWNIRRGKSIKINQSLVVKLGRGEDGRRLLTQYRVSFWDDDNVLEKSQWMLCNCKNSKNTELYHLRGWISYYVNYVSIKLLYFPFLNQW